MTYTSLLALQRRFGAGMLVQLTDRAPVSTGLLDQTVVDQALADTDAVIDASLAVRYRLPLAATPAVVADLALAIAIYKLHVVEPDGKIARDYLQALKDLDKIASGEKRIDAAGLEPDSSGASGVLTFDRDRELTPDTLRGYV